MSETRAEAKERVLRERVTALLPSVTASCGLSADDPVLDALVLQAARFVANMWIVRTWRTLGVGATGSLSGLEAAVTDTARTMLKTYLEATGLSAEHCDALWFVAYEVGIDGANAAHMTPLQPTLLEAS